MKDILVTLVLLMFALAVVAQSGATSEELVFIADSVQREKLARINADYISKIRELHGSNQAGKEKMLKAAEYRLNRDSSIKALIGEHNWRLYKAQTSSSFKQQKNERERVIFEVEKLKKQLGLSESQTKVVMELLSSYEQKKKSILVSGKAPAKIKTELKGEQQKKDDELRKNLNKGQRDKYNALNQ